MEYVAIVTILVLIQYLWFGTEVGIMRGRHGVNAPAITGAPEFERMFRVQQNTMEQLVVFVPALWLYATYVSATWAAGLGLVFIAARFVYRYSYVRDPAARSLGFTAGFLVTVVLLVGSLWNLVPAVF
jgi:uncharacterized MAPEG superfamily protein